MAKINLETEPRFKEMLKQLGFKKSRGVFGRNEKESIMELRFGHGTYGQKFVRYYDCVKQKGIEKWYIFLKKIGISKGSYYFLRN